MTKELDPAAGNSVAAAYTLQLPVPVVEDNWVMSHAGRSTCKEEDVALWLDFWCLC